MVPFRILLNHSRPTKILQFSKFLKPSFHKSVSLLSQHKFLRQLENSHCNHHLGCAGYFSSSRYNPNVSSSSFFHSSNQRLQSNKSEPESDKDKIALLSSQMNMRLLNENSFLSWCRNAYLSSVVGIAMMEEATSSLGQTAGFGAFLVGGMNVFWGTGCHVINLVRLRHASGMSVATLSLHILGSMLHCLLWLFILTCYIGFLDDPEYKKRKEDKKTVRDSD